MCNFDLAWRGKCEWPVIENTDFCSEHTGLKCASCGGAATHECDETMGPMVCGVYLCSNCEHRIDPSGTNGNGGHVKKDQQEYRPWYRRKFIRDQPGLLVKATDALQQLVAPMATARTEKPEDIFLKVYEESLLSTLKTVCENTFYGVKDKLQLVVRELDSFYRTMTNPHCYSEHLKRSLDMVRRFFDEYKSSIEYAETPQEMKAYLDSQKEKQHVTT